MTYLIRFIPLQLQSAPEKAHSLMLCLCHFAIVCSKSRGFHENAQKLIGNTRNWQILNIVIKCSLFSSW